MSGPVGCRECPHPRTGRACPSGVQSGACPPPREPVGCCDAASSSPLCRSPAIRETSGSDDGPKAPSRNAPRRSTPAGLPGQSLACRVVQRRIPVLRKCVQIRRQNVTVETIGLSRIVFLRWNGRHRVAGDDLGSSARGRPADPYPTRLSVASPRRRCSIDIPVAARLRIHTHRRPGAVF